MKKFRKLLLMAMFLGIFSLGFSKTIFEVNSSDESANLREKASSSSRILARLDNEEDGEIIKKEGNWYYVKYKTRNGKMLYGYIHDSQIAVGEIYVVNSKDGYANVRNLNSSSSPILEKLSNGTKVIKYSQKGEWYSIKFNVNDGLGEDYGYIHKSQVRKMK